MQNSRKNNLMGKKTSVRTGGQKKWVAIHVVYIEKGLISSYSGKSSENARWVIGCCHIKYRFPPTQSGHHSIFIYVESL